MKLVEISQQCGLLLLLLFFNFTRTNPMPSGIIPLLVCWVRETGIKLREKNDLQFNVHEWSKQMWLRSGLWTIPTNVQHSWLHRNPIKVYSTHRNEFFMPNVYLFMVVCWWSSAVHTILMEQIKHGKHILWMTMSCGMYAIRDLMIFGLPHLFSYSSSSSFLARIFIIYQPFLTMMMVSFLSFYFFLGAFFAQSLQSERARATFTWRWLRLAPLAITNWINIYSCTRTHTHTHTRRRQHSYFSNFEPFFVVFFPFSSATETIFSS